MSDQMTALESPAREARKLPWGRRLMLFLRIVAGFSLLKGLYHWALVLGIGDGAGSTFEASAMPWQAATVFFAVIDLVAAVGLWLAAAWGGVADRGHLDDGDRADVSPGLWRAAVGRSDRDRHDRGLQRADLEGRQ